MDNRLKSKGHLKKGTPAVIRLAPLIVLSLVLAGASAVQGDPTTGVLIFVGLSLGFVLWRGHQRRVDRGEDHRYHGDNVAGHIVHGARKAAAFGIIASNMSRSSRVSIGPLALASLILERYHRKRGRK
jgi:hypothetical protein